MGTGHPVRKLPSQLAVVLCKGIFDDTTDPLLVGKVCHYMTIAGYWTASSCCHLIRFVRLLISIMRPPPEWG